MNDVDIAHVIQLAIAPVFLLTGVGALLNVLTNRLPRVVDRARKLEELMATSALPERVERWKQELRALSRRSRLISWAISLVVLSALLVCFVIVALFLSAVYGIGFSRGIGWLFIAAMMALIGALLIFLREVFIATANLRIGN